MSTTHTTWQGAVADSNKREQARVSKKYAGTGKKVSADVTKGGDTSFIDDPSPFGDDDPVTEGPDAPTRTHNAKRYARATALPLAKAKKILKSTDTLQK